MSYDKNIYYSPEAFGLKVELDVDRLEVMYEFDRFVIWSSQDGEFYWAEDSGCSCPEPFEGYTLSASRHGSLTDAVNDARVWVSAAQYSKTAAARRIEDFARENGIA